MTKELIDYHKTKMCLAGAEGRTEDYKFHKAAIELFEKLSLPSNLDEAAEKWKEEHFRREYYQTPKDAMSRSFKAGAEWMAGQGITVTGDTDDEYVSILEDVEKAICKIAPDSTVNIQIRK